MDKAQQRHDEAMRKLRERAAELTAKGRATLTATELFCQLNDAYSLGVIDGSDSEQEWHKQIGGCQP